jgi:hypothetical protein
VWSLVNWRGCGEGAHFEAVEQGDEVWLRGFDEGLKRLTSTVWDAAASRQSWLDRVRAGLVAFLGFFDDRPDLGRLLLLDAPTCDGALALRCEQRVLGVLTGLLDDGSPTAVGELMPEPQLVSELVAGGVVAVIRKWMLAPTGERLVELAPELMVFVVAPYLGQDLARAEREGAPTPPAGAAGRTFYKRASTPGPVAVVRAASTRSQGPNRSWRDAFSQTSGVGGSPGGGLADRSLCNREDKGVVDK